MTRPLALTAVLATLAVAGCGDDGGDGAAEPERTTADAAPTLPEPVPVTGAARVDLEERLLTEVPVTDEPDWLAVGFGSLWARRGDPTVLRIDPASGKVVSEITAAPFKPPVCQGLGVSDEAVWACANKGEIVKIDPDTDSVADRIRIDKLPDQGRLPSAAGQLWVITGAGTELTGIDLETGRPSTRVPLPGTCAELAAAESTLWAMCPFDDLVVRIDAEAGQVVGELELPGANNGAVAEDLWVAFDDGVAQVDQETLEVTSVYEAFAQFGGAVFATRDAVWAREPQGHFLVHIDPAEGRIVETIEAPKLTSGGDVVVIGDSLWATAYDDNALVELRATGE